MKPSNRRYVPLIVTAPLSVAVWLPMSTAGAPDWLTGLVAGVGIGIGILGVIAMRRRSC